ncbi:hypothetical protein CTI14_70000, partial [Methylobacterium radiotolerans]
RRKRPNRAPMATMRMLIVVSRRRAERRSISSATVLRPGSACRPAEAAEQGADGDHADAHRGVAQARREALDLLRD